MFLPVLYAFRDPSPLYKSSKRRNYLKPKNSAFSIKNAYLVCHQLPSRNKILRRSLTLIWFLDFATLCSYFNVEVCPYFIVGNKIFCFFKKGTFQGGRGESSSPKFWEGLLIKGRSDRFRFFFWGGGGAGGLGKKGWGQYFGWDWYPGGHYETQRTQIKK